MDKKIFVPTEINQSIKFSNGYKIFNNEHPIKEKLAFRNKAN